jgi:hypothetical protein
LNKVQAGLDLDLVADTFLPRQQGQGFDLGSIAGKFVSDLLNSASSTGTVQFNRAGVVAKSGKQLDASLNARLALPLPFPVTVNIAYMSIDTVRVDSDALLGVDVRGLVYDNANNTQLSATATVQDTVAIQNKLRDVVAGYVQSGKFPSNAGVVGIKLGASSQDTIQAFSKVAVSLPIDPVGQPVAKFAIDTFKNALNGIPGGQLGGILNGGNNNNNNNNNNNGSISGPITIQLGQNISVSLTRAEVGFASGAKVNAKLTAALNFPFALDANVPFVAVELGLDDVKALSTEVTGVNVVGGGSSSLVLDSGTQIHDSDSLATSVANMADAFFANAATIPGNLRISGAKLGVSNSDAISAFSGVAIPIPANMLLQPFISGVNRTIDPVALLNRFGFSLSDIGVQTVPGRSIQATVGAGFNDFFPLAVQLPYVALSAGLDNVGVVNVGVRDIQLQPGANAMKLNANAQFPSSDAIKDKVAAFTDSLSKGGFGSTNEDFAVSGLVFGVSSSDSIKALSKMRIKLPSRTLLTESNFNLILTLVGLKPSDLNLEELVKRLDIQKAHLDGAQAGKLRVDAIVGVKGLKLKADVNLGFAGAGALLDGAG